jgi:hypothetical protein
VPELPIVVTDFATEKPAHETVEKVDHDALLSTNEPADQIAGHSNAESISISDIQKRAAGLSERQLEILRVYRANHFTLRGMHRRFRTTIMGLQKSLWEICTVLGINSSDQLKMATIIICRNDHGARLEHDDEQINS